MVYRKKEFQFGATGPFFLAFGTPVEQGFQMVQTLIKPFSKHDVAPNMKM